MWIIFIVYCYNYVFFFYRDSYSVALAYETKLFKLSSLQSNALKSLEVIMTSSMFVDLLVNANTSKSKQCDANKNSVNDGKKNRDKSGENNNMNDILSFLFR